MPNRIGECDWPYPGTCLDHARACTAGVDRLIEAATAYQQAITCCDELGDAPLATEPCAGLALIALRQDALAEVQQLVETILTVLAEQPRAGWNTPFDTYLTCYRVL